MIKHIEENFPFPFLNFRVLQFRVDLNFLKDSGLFLEVFEFIALWNNMLNAHLKKVKMR